MLLSSTLLPHCLSRNIAIGKDTHTIYHMSGCTNVIVCTYLNMNVHLCGRTSGGLDTSQSASCFSMQCYFPLKVNGTGMYRKFQFVVHVYPRVMECKLG